MTIYNIDYIKEELETAAEKFANAPNGSLLFVWGKGFISNGIRIGQKLESITQTLKETGKFNIDWNFNTPTHVESKINATHSVSAEAIGVKEMQFARHIGKEIGLTLMKPIIINNNDIRWQRSAIRYLNSKIGTTLYNYLGVMSFVYRSFAWIFKWTPIKFHKWKFAQFCSEISANSFANCVGGGKFLSFTEGTSKISPEELYNYCKKSRFMEKEILIKPTIYKINGKLIKVKI